MCKKLICLITIVLCLGLTVTASADLIALYEFDTDFSDTAGHPTGPFDATVANGTPEVNADGKLVLVRSEQDAISCGTIVGSAPDLTFALWVNLSTDSEYIRLMGKNDGSENTPGWNVMVRPSSENNSIRPEWEGHGGGLWGNSVPVENAYVVGQWVHWVCTWDSATETLNIYIDGTLMETAVIAGANVANTADELYLGTSGFGGEYFDGMVDDFAIWDQALTPDEVLAVYTIGPLALDPRKASKPNPDDEATDVPRDVVLSWTPGESANTHDVYLGTVFDDVNDADRSDPRGVLANQGQNATTYDPGRLEIEKTYYWRVDEVNAPPTSHVVFKGDVWSFTTEVLAYPIDGNNITATASSTDKADTVPENTINGSGLDANDLHSMEPTEMWLSAEEKEPNRAWIEYELDKVCKLHEMWVWNYNVTMESVLGLGFKDVTIEYSTNGTDYTTLGTTHEFVRAPGLDDYAHNTTVDFSGAAAKYVRLTANSDWGDVLDQYGLSEVRFFDIPVYAREPSPDSGATDVSIGTIEEPIDVTLGFRAGRDAVTHDVYLSTNEQAVIDSNALVSTMTEASYGPLSLDLGTTYYWKINEVNEAETTTTWQGEIWNFSTPEFFVVDDFEDYNDYPPEIWAVWIDGYGIPENGATSGYPEPLDFLAGEHYMETTIVHGGDQSMPFFYSNTGTATYSEATRTFAVPQDWTKAGIQTLVLYLRAESLSEALDTTFSFTTGGDADFLSQTAISYYDGDAAQSGDISDNEESLMQTTVSGAGTVSFYWKVSSEGDYDFLEFYIDGSLQDQTSGTVDWQQMTYTITDSGSHTLEWRYVKDDSESGGNDCGWVDKLEWDGGGQPPSVPENTGQLYVKVNGARLDYPGNVADIRWMRWNIDLAPLDTNLQSVTTLAIGIDGDGASGTLYFDDFRLEPGISDVSPIAITIPVPNGDFEEIYKPGSTTITADLGGNWTNGVGPDTPMDGSQTAAYSDETTGTSVDVPGWINTPGCPPSYDWPVGCGSIAGEIVTPDGLYYYNCNGGDWGNAQGGTIVSDAPLATVESGLTYTLSMLATGPDGPATPVVLELLADGVALTPTSSVDPELSGEWQELSRTYDAASLSGHLGESLTIRLGVGSESIGGQSCFDAVSLSYPVSPVGWWQFEGNASDSSGNGYDGILSADPAPVWTIDPGRGNVLEFVQGGDTVDCGPGVCAGQDLTVALWINPADVMFMRPISCFDGDDYSAGPGWILMLRQDDWAPNVPPNVWFRMTGEVEGDAWDAGDLWINECWAPGEWVHMAFTFDEDTDTLSGYINGQLAGENVLPEGRGVASDTNPLIMGQVGGEEYQGLMDEVYIYDVVLTEAEISDLAGI